MLQVNDLTFSYSRRKPPVISDLSLTVEPGGIYGLLGLNGVGKTTLLNLMAGLLTPDRGDVTLNGINTRRRLPETLGDIFLVPEEFDLPAMSMREYARVTGAFYPKFSMEDLKECMDTFGLNLDDRLTDLSMGQRKKALLSFALSTNTSVLLLDEPTNGLDLPGKKALRGLIASSLNEERAILLSTHQIADIQNIIDHVIVMHDGGILLNVPLSAIADKIRFEVTSSPSVLSQALYSQPIFSGSIVILPNDDGRDTEIDLETFFYFTADQPETVGRLFS